MPGFDWGRVKWEQASKNWAQISSYGWGQLGSNTSTTLGRMGSALKIGVEESLGMAYVSPKRGIRGFLHETGGVTGLKREGFLGLKSTVGQPLRSRVKQAAFRSLGLGFTLLETYSGYQKEGAVGAVKGLATGMAWSTAPRMLGAVLGGAGAAVLGAGMVGAGLVSGGIELGRAARQHGKRIRDIEMGGGQVMNAIESAGAATMRQRSLTALQNTHINARMGFGNEAILMHRKLF